MSTRLEPFLLANVLLFIDDFETIRHFPLVSTNCFEVMVFIRTNPVGSFCKPVATILRFFPNINTLRVSISTMLNDVDTLPETITAIVVDRCDFRKPPEQQPTLVRIVTEIRDGMNSDEKTIDLSIFTSLRRLTLSKIPNEIIPPNHQLKRVRVHMTGWERRPLKQLFGDWNEQLDVVTQSVFGFNKLQERSHTPNVHFFCAEIGDGVGPREFASRFGHQVMVDVRPSKTFNEDDLRVFDDQTLVSLSFCLISTSRDLRRNILTPRSSLG